MLGCCLVLASFGCESTDGTKDDEGGGAPNIELGDANNYVTESSLSIPTIQTAPGVDLDICWGELTSDLQCHDLDPQPDIDNVALLRFLHLSEEEVEQRLAGSQLSQSEVAGYVDYKTDHQSTCTKLSSLSLFGTPIELAEEYVESSDYTYMLLFAEGTTPGVGARSMIFIEPTSASTNTMVEATSGCGLLSFSADLASVDPVPVPSAGPWVVDWRKVTRDGQGNPVAFESIDGLLIGFYEGTTAEQIQEQIFDLELMATSLWELQLTGGRTANLANAQQRGTGEPFPGFGAFGAGTWLLALMCSTCQNPAPIVLTVLSPTEGP